MKKIFQKLLLLTLVGSFVFLYSCGGDDEPEPGKDAPTFNVNASIVGGAALTDGGDVQAGDTVSFDISVTAPGGFNTFRVSGSATLEFTRTDLELEAGATSADVAFNILTDESQEGSTATFGFTAVDDQDSTLSSTFTFNVVAPPSPDARAYDAVLLFAPLADQSSETFFSTNTGSTYSMATVLDTTDPISADIDFGYFFGANTGATLSDPTSYPFAYGQAGWGTLNSTTFRTTDMTASAFTEVTTWADIEAAYEEADDADSDPGIESGLTADQVLAFKTDADKEGGSKLGLILINEITGEDGVTGKIDITVLVQEEASN